MGVIKDSRAAQAIKQLALQIEQINEGADLEHWLVSTAIQIERIFGPEDQLVRQFKWIQQHGTDRTCDQTSSKAILYALIDTLKYFGYPGDPNPGRDSSSVRNN
jgi:hypothetical protein